jgi:DNA-binding transcriptional ArsR family regulator
MGLTKSDKFTGEQNKLAQLLKAMAHPARIAILQNIIQAKACICRDIVDELGLAQATISQHLKELKDAGLIKGTIEGAGICYCINPENWKLLETHLSAFLGSYKDPGNCC